jgi:hypothetical protein
LPEVQTPTPTVWTGHYPDTSDRDTNNTDENIDDAEEDNKQVTQIAKDVLPFMGTPVMLWDLIFGIMSFNILLFSLLVFAFIHLNKC